MQLTTSYSMDTVNSQIQPTAALPAFGRIDCVSLLHYLASALPTAKASVPLKSLAHSGYDQPHEPSATAYLRQLSKQTD
jgi:hypothetical protein